VAQDNPTIAKFLHNPLHRELSYVSIVLTVYRFLDLDTNVATVDCHSDDTKFPSLSCQAIYKSGDRLLEIHRTAGCQIAVCCSLVVAVPVRGEISDLRFFCLLTCCRHGRQAHSSERGALLVR
jgi:hypothetical protein